MWASRGSQTERGHQETKPLRPDLPLACNTAEKHLRTDPTTTRLQRDMRSPQQQTPRWRHLLNALNKSTS